MEGKGSRIAMSHFVKHPLTEHTRDVLEEVRKYCPPGYGLACGSLGQGFYHRDSPNLPRDLQREWNARQSLGEEGGVYKLE